MLYFERTELWLASRLARYRRIGSCCSTLVDQSSSIWAKRKQASHDQRLGRHAYSNSCFFTSFRKSLDTSVSLIVTELESSRSDSIRELSAFDIMFYSIRRFFSFLTIITPLEPIRLDLTRTHFEMSGCLVRPALQNLCIHSLGP